MKKISYLKSKKAYSLIEMSVVMAIAAILGLLSIGGYTAVRRQLLVDQAAEEVLNNIREQRNNALYVKNIDHPNASYKNHTRAWMVSFGSTKLDVYNMGFAALATSTNPLPGTCNTTAYRCLDNLSWPTSPITYGKSYPLKNDTRITTVAYNGLGATYSTKPHLTFSTPFSRPYLTVNEPTVANQGTASCTRWYWQGCPSGPTNTCTPTASGCFWTENNLPTREFYPLITDQTKVKELFSNAAAYLEITISRGSVSRKIKIDSSGEAKIVQ